LTLNAETSGTTSLLHSNFEFTISQKELEHQALLFWSVDTLSIPASLKVSLPTIHIGITFLVPFILQAEENKICMF
jgi:hypothetical protein